MNHKHKNSEKLELTPELAEIIGIMLGDGCIYYAASRKQYHTSVSFNKEETDYLVYVQALFENYFKSYKFAIIDNKTEFFIRSCSVFVGEKLIELGLKSGNKIKNKLVVPSWIMDNQVFSEKCLRGLFDTDGCVYKKYDRYAQIQIKMGSEIMIQSIRQLLNRLGYHPTQIQREYFDQCFSWKIYLSQQGEIDAFFQKIKPKNIKHVNRYLKIKSGDAGNLNESVCADSFLNPD